MMDNFHLAQILHEVSEGQTHVIFRRFLDESKEADFITRNDVEGYANFMIQDGDPRIWRYIINEQYGNAEKLNNFLAAVGVRLASQGYKTVLGNYSGGVYPLEDITSGKFDHLLRAINQYPDHMHLGVHEYTLGLLPFGIGTWAVEQLLNPPALQPKYWTIPQNYGKIDNRYPPFYHLLRHQWFNIRCQDLGIPIVKKVVTEFGLDYMPDFARTGIYTAIARAYGTGGMNEIRGHRSYEGMWAVLFPQWSYWKAYYEQLMWAEKVYPNDVIGWNLFAWNEWWNDRGFKLSDSDELLSYLEENVSREPEAKELPTMEKTAPKPANAGRGIVTKVTSPAVANIRLTAEGSDIGDVYAGEQVIVYPATLTEVKTKYRWVFIEVVGKNKAGWVYDGVQYADNVFPTTPDPVDPLDAYLKNLSPAQRSLMKQMLSELVGVL